MGGIVHWKSNNRMKNSSAQGAKDLWPEREIFDLDISMGSWYSFGCGCEQEFPKKLGKAFGPADPSDSETWCKASLPGFFGGDDDGAGGGQQ